MRVSQAENALSEEMLLEVANVTPDPNQPRKYFNPQSVAKLAANISKHGQKTPITVRESPNGSPCKWIIVKGERRWTACQVAHITEIRACVSKVSDPQEVYVDQIIDDMFGEKHIPLDIARSLLRLKDEFKWSVSQIAGLYEKTDAWVYQHLQLLRLAPDVAELTHPDVHSDNRLKFQIALLIASPNSNFPHEVQRELAAKVCKKGMTLKRARRIIETHAAREGIEFGGSTTRRPSAGWGRFDKFITATAEGLELWGEMEDQLPGICANREIIEIEIAVDMLLQFAEDAKSIREVLQDILREKKKATSRKTAG